MKHLVSLTFILLISMGVHAQGVKLKKIWDEVETKMSEGKEKVKTKCGKEISVAFDKASFGNDNVGKAFWCRADLEALSTLCEDTDYKNAIGKKIQTVKCRYDTSVVSGSPNHGNKFELKAGFFSHSYNKNSANLESRASDWMKDNL